MRWFDGEYEIKCNDNCEFCPFNNDPTLVSCMLALIIDWKTES